MAATFYDWSIPPEEQPRPADYAYDLDRALSSIVSITAHIPEQAYTALTMGVERRGSGVLIREPDLILTIGYLIAEAELIWLTAWDGRVIEGRVLAYNISSGLGLVRALEPLDIPALPLGDSRGLDQGDRVVVGVAGGPRRSVAGAIVGRREFAGYWEYVLDDAIFTAPAHPYWGGAALIGPDGALVGVGSLRLETRSAAGKITPINMMVPVELAKTLISQLDTPGDLRPSRPWLGVFAREDDEDVVLSGVAANGPAERAELRQGDTVLAVAGEPIEGLADFYRRVWALGPAGVDVPLTLKREGDVFDVVMRSRDRTRMSRPLKTG